MLVVNDATLPAQNRTTKNIFTYLRRKQEMKANQILKLLCIMGFYVLCSGCGPKMKTMYHLTPPDSAGGGVCTGQCENARYQCERNDDEDYRRCKDRAEDDYERCKDNNEYRRKKDQEYCVRQYCAKPKEEHCLDRYHSCYESCGGRVTSETVCVANCN